MSLFSKQNFLIYFLPIILFVGAVLVWVSFFTSSSNIDKKNYAFKQTVESDPTQKLQVQAGDLDKMDPVFTLQKWDGEVSLKMTPDFQKQALDSERSLTQADNKLVFKNGSKEEIHMYDLPKNTLNPGGGYEIEWILNEKPESNVFNFNLETSGLDFYYQSPLIEEPRPGEACGETQCVKNGKITRTRPENVIGSYAVYATGKKNDYSDLGGKNYGTGKVGHIYRPLITDAKGNKIWGDLHIDKQKKFLAISVPEKFLNTAAYPVIVDPTFGYAVQGASSAAVSPGLMNFSQAGYTGNLGAGISMSMYASSVSGSENVQMAVYTESGGTFTLVANGSTNAVAVSTTAQWWTANFASAPSLSATTYYLLLNHDSANDLNLRYDTTGKTLYYKAQTYGSWPATFTSPTSFVAGEYSIYVTYINPAHVAIRGGASVGLVQAVPGVNFFGGTTAFPAYTSNNTAGNTSVVLIQWFMAAGAATVSSVTDTRGNTYTVIPATLQNVGPTTNYANLYTQIAYATNIAAGANTVTVTWNTAVSSNFASLYELTPSTLDQTSIGTGTSASPSAGSVTTTANGEFALAVALIDDGAGSPGSFTAGSGWTINQNAGGGAAAEATEYRTQTSAGSLTGNFTSNSGTWVASMATFKPTVTNSAVKLRGGAGATSLVGTPVAGSGAPASLAYTIVGAGNMLMACVAIGDTVTLSVSDTKSNTWTPVSAVQQGNTRSVQCYWAIANSNGADTVSCSSQFGDPVHCAVMEIAGAKTTSPIDTSSTGTAASGTALDSGAFVTTEKDFLVGFAYAPGNSPAANGSWSSAASTVSVNLLYQANKVAGSYNATATAGGSVAWIIQGFGVKTGPPIGVKFR